MLPSRTELTGEVPVGPLFVQTVQPGAGRNWHDRGRSWFDRAD
jgi:hypothetical protein